MYKRQGIDPTLFSRFWWFSLDFNSFPNILCPASPMCSTPVLSLIHILSIFGILALTLWPTYIWEDSPGIWGNIRILIERPAWKSSLSVVPFSVFKDYYEDLLKSPVYFFVTLINFFGNLAMFIPIGFFSALLFRNATLKRSAIIGFGMSTFIEFAQYFIMRNTAVDDIILNTLGAICGYCLL